MELFWQITQDARVKLMQYQAKRHRTKLDIASETPPWLRPKPALKIPVSMDMTDEKLDKFIRQAPRRQKRVK